MLISHLHKFITIDIPKTGTRSLRETLCPLGVIDIVGEPSTSAEFYQHGTVIDAKQQFEKNDWCWDDYFKFTIVRDPWSRYFSFFKYFKNYADMFLNQDKSITWNTAEINQGKYCVSLFSNNDEQTVLKNIINNNPSQDLFYCNENDEVIVDYIARFENIESEFSFLCDHVSLSHLILRHDNKSKIVIDIHDVYNQQLIDLVSKKEKRTIELKNYNI